MNVVGQQRPGEAVGVGLDEEPGEASKKLLAVTVVAEDGATVDAADDHMLEQVGSIETCGSWHVGTIAAASTLVN